MKKTILTISVIALIAVSCNTNNKKNPDQEEVAPKTSEKIQDTLSAEIEKSKKEIEESAEKLDELLKEL